MIYKTRRARRRLEYQAPSLSSPWCSIAVEGLRRVVGQKGLEGVPVKRGDVIGWGGVKLIQRQRFKRGVTRAVIADGKFHDGLLQVAALAMHRHGPKGEATAVRLTVGSRERAVGCWQGLHLLEQSANKRLLQSEQGESFLAQGPVARAQLTVSGVM